MTIKEIIDGLKFTMEMCLYNPTDGSMRPVSTLNDMDKTTYDACEGAIKLLEQQRWIPVSERLPLCEQEVLICTQSRSISGETKSIITSAIYEDGNMRECYSRWHWEDIEYESWDEEEDCGIIPEGWWEYRHYNPDEVYNNLVDDFILAWMPLPQPYKEEQDGK